MTDPLSVAAAYTIVLGGLALYAASIVRRTRVAHRTAEALERERAADDGRDPSVGVVSPGVRPVESNR